MSKPPMTGQFQPANNEKKKKKKNRLHNPKENDTLPWRMTRGYHCDGRKRFPRTCAMWIKARRSHESVFVARRPRKHSGRASFRASRVPIPARTEFCVPQVDLSTDTVGSLMTLRRAPPKLSPGIGRFALQNDAPGRDRTPAGTAWPGAQLVSGAEKNGERKGTPSQ